MLITSMRPTHRLLQREFKYNVLRGGTMELLSTVVRRWVEHLRLSISNHIMALTYLVPRLDL